ncbi:hypothetical protein HZH68_001558 [Vespula germanica]|uniref:Uncharacterized protein n=1 Tax=Vespula germanica TaxID=30212 RepID=A0A834U734_VESGE|nr:hypothetical protein HZH68_001558 [Vespula germanica]
MIGDRNSEMAVGRSVEGKRISSLRSRSSDFFSVEVGPAEGSSFPFQVTGGAVLQRQSPLSRWPYPSHVKKEKKEKYEKEEEEEKERVEEEEAEVKVEVEGEEEEEEEKDEEEEELKSLGIQKQERPRNELATRKQHQRDGLGSTFLSEKSTSHFRRFKNEWHILPPPTILVCSFYKIKTTDGSFIPSTIVELRLGIRLKMKGGSNR